MTETIRYSRIYQQDLDIGTGTGQVQLADGRVVTLDQISLDLIANEIAFRPALLPYKVLSTRWYAMAGYATFDEALQAIGSDTRTLIIATSTTIEANTTIPSNVTLWFTGEGSFTVTSGLTLTLHSPGQIIASPRRSIFAGAGTVTFSSPGEVSTGWFGVTINGSTDDGPALLRMVTACPAKSTYRFVPGTYKCNNELPITADDITVHLEGATLDISAIAGTGTASVHVSADVLAGFKVTGDRFTLHGGRITGIATIGGKNVVGVLCDATDYSRIVMTKADTCYCGFWAGNNATNFTLDTVEVTSCTRNILLGYQPLTVSSPQVTIATLINVSSHDATGGDGVKLYSFSREVEILGGHYHDNSNNGIDMYVCGEYVLVDGVNCEGNTVDGIDLKYTTDSGEGANQLGFARRTTIRSSFFRNNGEYGIRAHIEAAFTGTDLGVQNATIEGNLCEGNGVHGGIFGLAQSNVSGNLFVRNTQRGAMFTSCQNVSVIGNHFWDNGASGATKSGCVWGTGLYAGAGNSKKCTVIGNTAGDTRSGAGRFQDRGFEFDVMDDCVIMGNTGTNHSTADFLCSVTATGGTRSAYNAGTLESGSTMFGVYGVPVVATASLPAAGATQDGLIIIDNNGAGDRNLMIYAGGQRFRIDGGAAV